MPAQAVLGSLLLTDGWSRAPGRRDTIRSPAADTLGTQWTGQVLFAGKPAHGRNIRVQAFSAAHIAVVGADRNGRFTLQPDDVLGPSDGNVLLAVKDGSGDYNFRMDDAMGRLEARLARLPVPAPAAAAPWESPVAEEPRSKTLQTVVIGSRREALQPETGTYHRPGCQDYVCQYDILNCPNHPNATDKPIPGKNYRYYEPFTRRLSSISYRSCNPDGAGFFRIAGRALPRRFLAADFSTATDIPEENTTIHWDPRVLTDENGEATIVFYTNDLVGPILIQVQGFSQGGLLSGRQLIRVQAD